MRRYLPTEAGPLVIEDPWLREDGRLPQAEGVLVRPASAAMIRNVERGSDAMVVNEVCFQKIHEEKGEGDLVRRRLEYLLSATSAVIYACAAVPPYGATFVSDNVTAVLGYTARAFCEEAIFWADRIHPDDRQRVLAEVPRIFEVGRHSHEYRFLHGDGTYRWLQDDLVLERDELGSPREIVGCMVDVTARREVESALRRSEANFRALIEELPISVLVHRDDMIVYSNPALLSLLGYARAEELVGHSPLKVVPRPDQDVVRSRIDRFDDPDLRKNPIFEETLLRKNGSTVTVEIEAIKLDFDGVSSIVVIARDLSERRQILARLAAADRLASVGTLAAGVAHEINNPLAFVQMNLAMLAREVPALLSNSTDARLALSDVELLLEDTREGVARMGALVRDLRALSHPDQQRLMHVDVHEVFASCLRMAQPEIRQRAHVSITRGEIPLVQGNASRLGQVFLNLLINAAHAIPEGDPGAHEIRVATYPAASGDVVVEVADSGCGIAPDVLGHIFDPFFTTKPVGVGTGLGLAICHSIIRGMGGQITVESELGRGATFRVILPVSAGLVPTVDAVSAAPLIERRRRILVIDDERAFSDALRMSLAERHDVVTTQRATVAIDRIRAGESFDMVLCDLMMPEMSGVDLYEQIARVAPSILGRLVFMTGGAFTPSSREFLERVPNRRLEKPFEISALFTVLDEICAGNASSDDPDQRCR